MTRLSLFSVVLDLGSSSARDQVTIGVGYPEATQSSRTVCPRDTKTVSGNVLMKDTGTGRNTKCTTNKIEFSQDNYI